MRYLDMIPLATGVERLPPDIQVAISDPKSSLGVVSAGFHIVMGVSFTARPYDRSRAHVNGIVAAERVVVDGKVEGPIQGGDVVLKSQAHVVGDIHHQSLAIERGAYFDGRSIQVRGANGHQPERLGQRLKRVTNDSQELSPQLGAT